MVRGNILHGQIANHKMMNLPANHVDVCTAGGSQFIHLSTGEMLTILGTLWVGDGQGNSFELVKIALGQSDRKSHQLITLDSAVALHPTIITEAWLLQNTGSEGRSSHEGEDKDLSEHLRSGSDERSGSDFSR
jgi:hypothetical protein